MALTGINSTRDFFRIWFFWKKQAVCVFLLIVGVVMFYAYTCTPGYESTAKVLLLPKTNEGEVVTTGIDEKKITSISDKDLYTEIELIGSDTVLRDTVNSFPKKGMGLRAEERAWYYAVAGGLRKVVRKSLVFLKLKEEIGSPFDADVQLLKNSLDIQSEADSNIIHVTLRAEIPTAAASVLNSLLDIYVKHRNKVFTKEEGMQFYDDHASSYRIKLEKAEKGLKEFQKNWSIVNLASQNQANIDLLTKLNEQLRYLEISYDEGKSRIEILKNGLTQNINDVLVTKEMRDIPAIVELEKGIVPLLIRRSEISKTFTPSSREYKQITDQIRMIRGEIGNEIRKALMTDELELESLRMKKLSLQGKITELRQEASELNQRERKLQELRRVVALHKDNYMLYAAKTEDAKIYSERTRRNLANVSIADRADVPVSPAFPNRLLMLILAILFGASASICAPFILESLDNKLKTVEEVEKLLSLPVVCNFPEV
ncbi:MAG: GumC family protein [Thermodesulfovibrionia bacterium]|nr:GumC family protein [Thermodesulfovibrionia bacterium]